jgi:hypothetical protein
MEDAIGAILLAFERQIDNAGHEWLVMRFDNARTIHVMTHSGVGEVIVHEQPN